VATTSRTVNLPAGSVGDLILAFIGVDGIPNALSSAGWNKLGQDSYLTEVTGAVFWKRAEGGDALTVATSSNPQVRAVGAVASGTAAITPPFPTGVAAGDLLITFAESVGGEAYTLPAGWSHVPGSPLDQSTNTRLTVIYRFWQSGDVAPSLGDPGNHAVGRMIAFTGVDPVTPFDVTPTTATEATADTSASWPSVTTVTNSCTIVQAIATGRDAASTTNLGAVTNGALSGITEQVDNWISLGTGGGVGVVTASQAGAGATGSSTATMGSTDTKALLTIPLRPILEEASWVCLRVSGADDPTGTSADGTGGTANPPSHTPAVPFLDYLWIAAAITDGNTDFGEVPPTNYTDFTQEIATTAEGATTTTAERLLNNDVQNPVGFSASTSHWVAWTLAVPPGAATHVADASVSTTGTISGTADREAVASSTRTVTATITADGTVVSGLSADATRSVTATIAPAAISAKTDTASHSVTAIIAPAASTAKSVTGLALSAVASLTAAIALTSPGSASLPVTATITADASVAKAVTATRTVTATIAADGMVSSPLSADATRATTATITASATRNQAASVTQAVTAALVAAGLVTNEASSSRPVTATITGTGATAKSVSATRTATATITADAVVGLAPIPIESSRPVTATITATGQRTQAASASRTTTATVTASAQQDHTSSSSRTVTATITVDGVVTENQLTSAERSVTASVTVDGSMGRAAIADRPVTAVLAAAAAVEGSRTATRTVTATITAEATTEEPIPFSLNPGQPRAEIMSARPITELVVGRPRRDQ
jgi:hypothetical protein